MAISSSMREALWRWRQIALGAFTGVRAVDWTDDVTTASSAPLEFGRNYPFDFDAYYSAHPEEDRRLYSSSTQSLELSSPNPDYVFDRRIDNVLQPFCRAGRSCATAARMAAFYFFPREAGFVANAAEAARSVATLNNVFVFLGVPFLVGIGSGLTSTAISMVWAGGDPVPETCNSASEDTIVLSRLMESGLVTGEQVAAIRATITNTNNNVQAGLTAALVPRDAANSFYCEAPDVPAGTFPSLSRVKRSILQDHPEYEAWLEDKAKRLTA